MYSFRAKDRRRRLLQTFEVRHEFIKLIVGNRRKRRHIIAGFELLRVVYPRPQVFWRIREDLAVKLRHGSGSGWINLVPRSPLPVRWQVKQLGEPLPWHRLRRLAWTLLLPVTHPDSSTSSTTTWKLMLACSWPQYSVHSPRNVPVLSALSHILLVRPGITSVLPAISGTQKLWMTLLEINSMSTTLPSGITISSAVTIFWSG
jgi:hypothetical protein